MLPHQFFQQTQQALGVSSSASMPAPAPARPLMPGLPPAFAGMHRAPLQTHGSGTPVPLAMPAYSAPLIAPAPTSYGLPAAGMAGAAATLAATPMRERGPWSTTLDSNAITEELSRQLWLAQQRRGNISAAPVESQRPRTPGLPPAPRSASVSARENVTWPSPSAVNTGELLLRPASSLSSLGSPAPRATTRTTLPRANSSNADLHTLARASSSYTNLSWMAPSTAAVDQPQTGIFKVSGVEHFRFVTDSGEVLELLTDPLVASPLDEYELEIVQKFGYYHKVMTGESKSKRHGYEAAVNELILRLVTYNKEKLFPRTRRLLGTIADEYRNQFPETMSRRVRKKQREADGTSRPRRKARTPSAPPRILPLLLPLIASKSSPSGSLQSARSTDTLNSHSSGLMSASSFASTSTTTIGHPHTPYPSFSSLGQGELEALNIIPSDFDQQQSWYPVSMLQPSSLKLQDWFNKLGFASTAFNEVAPDYSANGNGADNYESSGDDEVEFFDMGQVHARVQSWGTGYQ